MSALHVVVVNSVASNSFWWRRNAGSSHEFLDRAGLPTGVCPSACIYLSAYLQQGIRDKMSTPRTTLVIGMSFLSRPLLPRMQSQQQLRLSIVSYVRAWDEHD